MNTLTTRGNKQILLATVYYEPQKTLFIHLRKFAKELAEKIGLTPLRHDRQMYEPQGETLIYYLAESHICIESYPEHEILEIEVASCKEFCADALAEMAGQYDFAMGSVTLLRKDALNQWSIC